MAERIPTGRARGDAGERDARAEEPAARDRRPWPSTRLRRATRGSAVPDSTDAIPSILAQMTAAANFDSGSDSAFTASDSSLTSGLVSLS